MHLAVPGEPGLTAAARSVTVAAMDDSGAKGADRREHGRQPIELKVEYKRLNSFFSDYTRNISRGGTFIKTSRPLDVGTEFIFKLYVPNLDEPLRIVGRVQWVVTQDDLDAGRGRGPGEPGMGIRFVYRQPEDKAEIERRVEKVMIDSLGQLLYSRLMEQNQGSAAARADTGDALVTSSQATEGFGALVRRKQES
jgi:type IV pilus assembly protein PilZ